MLYSGKKRNKHSASKWTINNRKNNNEICLKTSLAKTEQDATAATGSHCLTVCVEGVQRVCVRPSSPQKIICFTRKQEGGTERRSLRDEGVRGLCLLRPSEGAGRFR